MLYRICPDCDAKLDPGKRCDRKDEKEAAPLVRKRPHESKAAPILSAAVQKVNKGGLEYGYR